MEAGRLQSALSAAEENSILGLTNRAEINRLRARLDERRREAIALGNEINSLKRQRQDLQDDLIQAQTLAASNGCGSLA